MRVLITVIALAFSSLALGSADAAMPYFEPEAYCRGMLGSSEIIRGACKSNEQTSYDVLKGQWDSLPNSLRQKCEKDARAAGGSYLILMWCVQAQESEATPFRR
jgi:hypothetical protein